MKNGYCLGVTPMTALICVGMIAGAYGVRGEVRVKSYCAKPSDIEHYAPLLDETGARALSCL